MDEIVKVSVELTKYHVSKSRFSFRHVIYKVDGLKCATIEVDGAFMDLEKRKLAVIPDGGK
jgi:acyl-CoA thioester hydrolase